MADKTTNLLQFPTTEQTLAASYLHISEGGVDKKISLADFITSVNGGNPFNVTIKEETSNSRTLTISDKNAYIRFLSNLQTSVTVNSAATDGWKKGDSVIFRKEGVGEVVLTSGTNVTLLGASSGLTLTEAGQVGQLLCVDDNPTATVFDFVTGGNANELTYRPIEIFNPDKVYEDDSVRVETADNSVWEVRPTALPIAAGPFNPEKWVLIRKKYDDLIVVETFAALREVYSARLSDGTVIQVADEIQGGLFQVKTGTVVDNDGTLIVFDDDTNRYAERIFDGVHNIRWFGVKGDGTDAPSAIDTALAKLPAGFTVEFPAGNYTGFNNTHSNTTFIVYEGTVFNGTVHAAISNNDLIKTENVTYIGTIVTDDRVGTYNCKNVVIPAIRQISGNRGVHFYFNTVNLWVGSIHVEGLQNVSTETSKCIFIDSTTGKDPSENIWIGSIVTDATANGAQTSLSIESDNARVSSVYVGKLVSKGANYDLFTVGDGVNECNYEVASIEVDGGDNAAVYMNNVHGLEIGTVKAVGNKGGAAVRQVGINKKINIGKMQMKAVGVNVALSDARRSALIILNPEGFSLESLVVDSVGGSNALNITNATGDRILLGRVEIKNPSLRSLVPSANFRNIHIKELIISGATSDGIKGVSTSVIEDVEIDYLEIDGAGGNGVFLENCTISDVTIGKLKTKNNTLNGIHILNTSNDTSGLKIHSLVARGNTQHGVFLEDQDQGVYIGDIQSSDNMQGIRAVDATDLNINGGHITGNTTGVATSGTVTGWLVSGLRVDGNTTNGTLPGDVSSGNIIAP